MGDRRDGQSGGDVTDSISTCKPEPAQAPSIWWIASTEVRYQLTVVSTGMTADGSVAAEYTGECGFKDKSPKWP
jgi:hypothetical protein